MKRLFVGLIVVSLLIGTASATEIVDLDTDTDLTSQDSIAQFQEEEYTHVELKRYGTTIRIAQDHEDLDISGTHADLTNVWMQIEYTEGIDRTFKFHVPAEYWDPYVHDGMQSLDGDARISLLPIKNRSYTSVTIQLSEPGTYNFAMSRTAGKIFKWREEGRSFLEKEYNVTIPSLSGAENDWSFVEPDKFSSDNTTYNLSIGRPATVQYNATDSWLRVTSCDARVKPVCTFDKNGTLFVLSSVEDPPLVRYKPGQDTVSDVDAAINQLLKVPDRIGKFIQELLGSIL